MLLNKSRSVRRVNDRRVLNGIFRVLRSGAPWRDLPLRALHDLLQSLHLVDRLIEAFAPNRGNLIAVPSATAGAAVLRCGRAASSTS